MIISEKDISKNESNNQQTPKGIKIGKILKIVAAVFAVLVIFGAILPDDEAEDQNAESSSVEEKVVPASENDSVKTDSVSNKPIKPLMLSDFKFGTKKKDIFKLFEDKGWAFNGESNNKNLNGMDSLFMFNVHDTALFQNYIAYRFDVGFDEDDKLQFLFVCFDVSPDAMKRQEFSTLDEVLFALSDDCLEKQGYKRVELPEEVRDHWFFEKGENLAYLNFAKAKVDENNGVTIIYMSRIAVEKQQVLMEAAGLM
ncbi:MAG: hypothetical protein J6X67_00255 [Treponema sp.]|nr:hypothetical protein [Treponema sp.]